MTVAVRGRVPRWAKDEKAEQAAQHIQERLQALERALAGGAPTFLAPSVPIFGSGPVSGGGSGGGSGWGSGGGGVTDHGLLAGLLDDDHPQYLQHGESVLSSPHVHSADEVVGLDQRFARSLERQRPTPHKHSVFDVADLRANDAQFILAGQVFGG